jgi:hypothetical protein
MTDFTTLYNLRRAYSTATPTEWMIAASLGEAGGEGPLGTALVADVMRNRAAEPLFQRQYGTGVVDQILGVNGSRPEFDVWMPTVNGQRNGAYVNATNFLDHLDQYRLGDLTWASDRLKGQINNAVQGVNSIGGADGSGPLTGVSGGAQYYLNPDVATNSWAANTYPQGTFTVGGHSFYGPRMQGPSSVLQGVLQNGFPTDAGNIPLNQFSQQNPTDPGETFGPGFGALYGPDDLSGGVSANWWDQPAYGGWGTQSQDYGYGSPYQYIGGQDFSQQNMGVYGGGLADFGQGITPQGMGGASANWWDQPAYGGYGTQSQDYGYGSPYQYIGGQDFSQANMGVYGGYNPASAWGGYPWYGMQGGNPFEQNAYASWGADNGLSGASADWWNQPAYGGYGTQSQDYGYGSPKPVHTARRTSRRPTWAARGSTGMYSPYQFRMGKEQALVRVCRLGDYSFSQANMAGGAQPQFINGIWQRPTWERRAPWDKEPDHRKAPTTPPRRGFLIPTTHMASTHSRTWASTAVTILPLRTAGTRGTACRAVTRSNRTPTQAPGAYDFSQANMGSQGAYGGFGAGMYSPYQYAPQDGQGAGSSQGPYGGYQPQAPNAYSFSGMNPYQWMLDSAGGTNPYYGSFNQGMSFPYQYAPQDGQGAGSSQGPYAGYQPSAPDPYGFNQYGMGSQGSYGGFGQGISPFDYGQYAPQDGQGAGSSQGPYGGYQPPAPSQYGFSGASMGGAQPQFINGFWQVNGPNGWELTGQPGVSDSPSQAAMDAQRGFSPYQPQPQQDYSFWGGFNNPFAGYQPQASADAGYGSGLGFGGPPDVGSMAYAQPSYPQYAPQDGMGSGSFNAAAAFPYAPQDGAGAGSSTGGMDPYQWMLASAGGTNPYYGSAPACRSSSPATSTATTGRLQRLQHHRHRQQCGQPRLLAECPIDQGTQRLQLPTDTSSKPTYSPATRSAYSTHRGRASTSAPSTRRRSRLTTGSPPRQRIPADCRVATVAVMAR